MEKNITLQNMPDDSNNHQANGDNESSPEYLFHDPCHTPMKQYNPVSVASKLLNKDVTLSERCCGESGTLGTARPDIAEQLRYRKRQNLHENIKQITGSDKVKNNEVKILTSCPSCQQGLARYTDDTGLKTDYIVIEMAKQMFGKNWEKQFIQKANNGGIEKVLL